jgi:tetratricopeptide (TPR) repeat protein
VPFDREATLRKAEKLVRQGKLEPAIAEYRAVVEDQPSDWNAANILGDLYIRVGEIDKAIAEYNRSAEHLAGEGFAPKAVALYRKILKIKPDEDRALWNLGSICARQGLMVDARTNLLALADLRRARGDSRGEAEVRARLGDLDNADIAARLAGARARVELGDTKTAVERLRIAAADLQQKGRDADALRLLTEAAEIDPEDRDLRRLLSRSYAGRGDFDAAAQFATSATELKAVADELFHQGREDEGINVLGSALDAEPADTGLRTELTRRLLARGDTAAARDVLKTAQVDADVGMVWTLAEIELRDGNTADGIEVMKRLIADDPGRREDLIALGCALAEVKPDAGYECIELAAKASIAADEWPAAAAALDAFVKLIPNHIPALMRLIEVCIDGGLESMIYGAQAQLADAYLAAGAGIEARVIAEDLVAREPWNKSNVERFRRALALLGEKNIDAIVADRVSGEAPFTSAAFDEPPRPAASVPASPAGKVPDELPASVMASAGPLASSSEIDLSEVLYDLRKGFGLVDASPNKLATPIETVLKGLRDDVAEDTSAETAEQHLNLAASMTELGLQEEAIKALEVAARSARHRFSACGRLARTYLGAGDRARAIEWYERAIEAHAPTADAHHAVLYELASLLEEQGERARALAILLELHADAGEYRDVATRLEQLKVQMGR